MIPKIIHYCWFGGKEIPALERKCLESWNRYLPDYEIRCWDESNFPTSDFDFAQGAYEAKRFAFVADVARLYALFHFGGIYLDTDVEILKPMDDLLDSSLFMGFETDNVIQTGVIGACPQNKIISTMLDYYVNKPGFDVAVDGAIANSELFANLFRSMNIPLDN